MPWIRWACRLAVAFAVAVPAHSATAQQAQRTQPAIAPVQAVAPAAVAPATLGPTFAAAQFGIHQEAAAPAELNRNAFKTSRREGRILAIVGGAAFLAGLLIGDDAGTVIAVGGAAVGLYGLYVWQR